MTTTDPANLLAVLLGWGVAGPHSEYLPSPTNHTNLTAHPHSILVRDKATRRVLFVLLQDAFRLAAVWLIAQVGVLIVGIDRGKDAVDGLHRGIPHERDLLPPLRAIVAAPSAKQSMCHRSIRTTGSGTTVRRSSVSSSESCTTTAGRELDAAPSAVAAAGIVVAETRAVEVGRGEKDYAATDDMPAPVGPNGSGRAKDAVSSVAAAAAAHIPRSPDDTLDY